MGISPLGGAGLPLFPASSTPGAPQTPLALQFDPTIPGFVQNADGTMTSIHPVDQKVALALFIEYGSISSAPTVGNKLRTLLNRVQPEQVNAIAGAELSRCLGPFIGAGEITLTGFTVTQTGSGRTSLSVAYVNLKDPRYTPAAAQAAARSLSGVLA
jgi:hypothetical protein